MPNRIIKESITTSPTIDRLSPEAERLFYRLMVKADDFGRYYGEAGVILGSCFPLKLAKLKVADAEKWIAELVLSGLVIRYGVGDRLYIQFSTWGSHQNIRAKESKFPAPPESPVAGDGICDQVMADAPVSRISDLVSRISILDTRTAEGAPPVDKVDKVKFAEFVTMTEAEHQKLTAEIGEPLAARCIEILNNYKGANGKRYKSDYLAIRNWVIQRAREEQAKGQAPAPKPLQKTVSKGRCFCEKPTLMTNKDSLGRITEVYCSECGEVLERYE